MARSTIAFATSLVIKERLRQIQEKGYSPVHDDEHDHEELAAAATFFLLPARLDFNVAHAIVDDLTLEPLTQLLAAQSFPGLFREDMELRREPSASELDQRIEIVTKGLALGMAELERILRLRHQADIAGIVDHTIDMPAMIATELAACLQRGGR